MKNKIPDVFMVSCAILCKKEGMAEYFKERCKNFAIITVIPNHAKDKKPQCEVFQNGKLVKSFNLFEVPEFLANKNKYFVHLGYVISIIYAAFRLRKKFEIFVGEGHIYSSAGILLKALKFFKKVIYSSGDYFVDVKSFQIIDEFLAKKVDAIWSASDPMKEERLKNIGKINTNCIQLTMPLGVEMNNEVIEKNNLDTKNLLFIGNIQKHQGLDLLIDVLPSLLKQFPDIKVKIIGSGIYQEDIKQKVIKLNLSSYVTFYGFIDSDEERNKIFANCICGVALYIPELSGFTKLSDPGKIKDYISSGLPVITTKVFPFSKELAEKKAGMVIDYEEDQLISAITELVKNRDVLRIYSKNAVTLARDFEWNKVLDRVYSETSVFWKKIDSHDKK